MQDVELEDLIGGLWRDALRAEALDPHVDFYAAGGDSLRLIQIVVQIEAILGVELDVRALGEVHRFDRLVAVARQAADVEVGQNAS